MQVVQRRIQIHTPVLLPPHKFARRPCWYFWSLPTCRGTQWHVVHTEFHEWFI